MNKPLILASSSPRRKDLLNQLQLPFSIYTSNVEELIPDKFSPERAVVYLAAKKAKAISQQYPASVVIGADTMVVSEGIILGKPKSKDEAFSTLKSLSGKVHEVLTGVSVQENQIEKNFFEKTIVTFNELTDDEILRYIESGEPFDKAGSYGIQGLGAVFVKKIEGDYFSVVGLPISKLYRTLKEIGAIR
ncbi:Maf family protein [Bacillus spongiae]|uniref:dTTP/UTP pyrophosphatase n=1 Tax=Bacillus spongiae TaxID=2683610 RepID=A0ABU8H901_9BACI